MTKIYRSFKKCDLYFPTQSLYETLLKCSMLEKYVFFNFFLFHKDLLSKITNKISCTVPYKNNFFFKL